MLFLAIIYLSALLPPPLPTAHPYNHSSPSSSSRMTSVEIPLDLLDSSITGVYMYNLISLWCERGLTSEQGEALSTVFRTAIYGFEDIFSKCLNKDIELFDRTRNQMMKTLDAWEEIPAWDEVWRLKLAFDRRSRIEVDPLVKLYTIAICKILPSMVLQVSES